jgi:hypothetical protein
MDNRKNDPAKQSPAEVSPNNLKIGKIELSDEELSGVSGGNSKLLQACATGQHIKEAKIT